LKKGLTVAANCASCHTAHNILPQTDPNSSISWRNIAATCGSANVGHHATVRSSPDPPYALGKPYNFAGLSTRMRWRISAGAQYASRSSCVASTGGVPL